MPSPETIAPSSVDDSTYGWYLSPEPNPPWLPVHIFPTGKHSSLSGAPFTADSNLLTGKSPERYTEYLEKDPIQTGGYGQKVLAGGWVPALVVLSLLLLTSIKVIYVQFLTPVLISVFKFKESRKLYHEKSVSAQNAFLILRIIFAINAGLFITFLADYFGLLPQEIKPPGFFAASAILIVLLYALKSLLLLVTGFLFDNLKIFSEYIHNISIYNKIYGVLLLPVIAGLLYLDGYLYSELIYAGIIMALAFYLLQLVRGFEIIIREGFSVFYLILYLCAFEILPLLVVFKFFLA